MSNNFLSFRGNFGNKEAKAALFNYLKNRETIYNTYRGRDCNLDFDGRYLVVNGEQCSDKCTKQFMGMIGLPTPVWDKIFFSKDLTDSSRKAVLQNLLGHFRKQPDKAVKPFEFYKLKFDDGSQKVNHNISCRSDKYAKVRLVDILKKLAEASRKVQNEITQWNISERYEHMTITFPSLEYSQAGYNDKIGKIYGSIEITNSETKDSRLRLEPGIWKLSCGNGARVAVKSMDTMDAIHRGNPASILKRTYTRVLDILSQFDEVFELIKAHAGVIIKRPLHYLEQVGEKFKLPDPVIKAVVQYYKSPDYATFKPDGSLFALSQAFTATANSRVTQGIYESLRDIGGALLTNPPQEKEVKAEA